MDGVFVSPGVYFREKDLSNYIPNLSSTICAMVITSTKGPTNVPTFVTNGAQLTETFGRPHPNHLGMYAAAEYLRHGQQLWVVRVNGSEADRAQAATVNGVAREGRLLGTISGPFVITGAYEAGTLGSNTAATVTVIATNKRLLVSINGGASVEVTLAEGVGRTKASIISEIDTALTPHGGKAEAGDVFQAGTGVANQVGIGTVGSGSSQRFDLLAISNAAYTLLGLTAGSYRGVNSNREWKLSSIDLQGSITPLTGALTVDEYTTDELVTALNTAFDTGTFPAIAYNINGRVAVYHTSASQQFGLRFDDPSADPTIDGLGSAIGISHGKVSYGRGLSPATETMKVFANSEGAWGNELTVTFTTGAAPDSFGIQIRQFGQLVESWDSLTSVPELEDPAFGKRYFASVINAAFPAGSKWVKMEDVVDNTGYPTPGTYRFAGGDDGLESISDEDFVGTVNGVTRTGMQHFGNAEERDINLLLCPGVCSAAVIREMILLCESRGDCMCLVDPPFGLNVQQVVDWHNGQGTYSDHAAFNSSYGALYYSWVQIYDANSERYVWLPPSGVVAGAYAFNDFVAEPWFAPAGLNRGLLVSANKVEHSPTQGERDHMYSGQNSVNPIVSFVKDGITLWGQRTLQRKPSDLDRVNVRRLVLYMRKVLATTYKYFAFEPNDPVTWRTFVATTEPFLQGLVSRRAVSKFLVVCDETTNTPDIIDQNTMAARIYIDAIEAAEQIVVDLVLTQTGAKFEELIY